MIRPDFQEQTFPHWSTMPIRYRDLDPLDHVNNAIFNTYYEEARIDFIRHIPEFSRQLMEGYSFVLAQIKIDYIRPVEFPATLKIGTGISKMGNSSITSFQAIYLDETHSLISVAEASGVWFSLEEKKPVRIPEFANRKQWIINKDLFKEADG